MSAWIIRPGEQRDEAVVAGTFMRSYSESRAGKSVGAHLPRSKRSELGEEFWESHRAVATALLATQVHVLCDATDDSVVWAWLAETPPHVHYCLVKRNVERAGLDGDVLKALLGDRLRRRTPYTLEQVCLREMDSLPSLWVPDYTFWLRALTNMP